MSQITTVRWNVTAGTSYREYPCRCGVTHTGVYAQEDWNHHNCFHGPFWPMGEIPGEESQQIICSQCGEIFELEKEKL